jgi:hypothetical protein
MYYDDGVRTAGPGPRGLASKFDAVLQKKMQKNVALIQFTTVYIRVQGLLLRALLLLLGARPRQDVPQRVIPLVTGVFKNGS